jgi:hypothetical protein
MKKQIANFLLYFGQMCYIDTVLLPRGDFQEIKCMKKLTTDGLFLTCTQEFYLYIYIIHKQGIRA